MNARAWVAGVALGLLTSPVTATEWQGDVWDALRAAQQRIAAYAPCGTRLPDGTLVALPVRHRAADGTVLDVCRPGQVSKGWTLDLTRHRGLFRKGD